MEKIWLKSYSPGVPAEINPDSYQSLTQMFLESCAEYKDLPAFYNLGVTLTYHQMDLYTQAFAAYLQHVLNLKKGDRIALMMPNVLQYPIAMLGALRAGLIVVNVNPLYTPPELIHQLKDSGTETIVVLKNFADTVQQAIASTPLKNIILTDIGDMLPRPKALLIHFILKYIKKSIPNVTIPNAIEFRDVLAKGKKFPLMPVEMNNRDIAFLQYTGGTTGVAKGAMLTHRNILANMQQAEAWYSQLFRLGREIVVTALPLYHIFSLTANCFFFVKLGGLNVLITNPRDIPRMVSEMGKFKFSVITGVNTLFNALLKEPSFSRLNFSSLRMTIGGGMSVHHVVADKWQQETGLPIFEAYGLTETSPCVTMNPITMTEYTGSVGLPVSSTDICILDDDGKELPIGQQGEIAVKGPQVMYGYWRNPTETQKVFTKDGWLLTGDIASVDEKGFVRIHERKKDMILVSGFNVYPNEIEDVLVRLQGVREAAVVGIPDENSGEAVKAFIVRDDPNLTAEDVVRYSHKNLTGYKVPKKVEFCDELPKSNIGKVLRRELRNGKASPVAPSERVQADVAQEHKIS